MKGDGTQPVTRRGRSTRGAMLGRAARRPGMAPAMRRLTVRTVLGALVSMLAVVVLPSEAWAATGSVSWSTYTTTLTASLDAGTGVLSYNVNTSGSGDPGNQFRIVGRCGSTWVTAGSGPITAGSTWQTQPTYGGPKTGTMTSSAIATMCGGAGALTAVRVDIGSSPSYATATVSVTLAAATPSTCSSYSNARASYIGTSLTVMFGWSGTVPSGGWRVHAPGDGYTDPTTTPQTVVPRTRLSGEAEYSATVTVSGLTAGSSTVRISSTAAPGCYVVVTPGSVALVNGMPNQGADPETGESCSTWDLFCQLRSAFTPSASSLDAWSDLGSEAAEVVPFGYILDGMEAFAYLDDSCGIDCAGTRIEDVCFDFGDLLSPADDCGVRPFTMDSPAFAWLQSNRAWLGTLAWLAVLLPLVGMVWRRFMPFGDGS